MRSRRREELRRSLDNPHPETIELTNAEFEEWFARLYDDETPALVDQRAGKPVRWLPGSGWIEDKN